MKNIEDCYFRDIRYADDSIDLIRGYHQLEKELLDIFDFVEPTDSNMKCHSHRLYGLLLRASTEFEANAKAILSANNYGKAKGNLNIKDYSKIDKAAKLSEYQVTIPIWSGKHRDIAPLQQWKSGYSLDWYQSYNNVKHSRSANFEEASLKNAVEAVSAVFVLLFSQFNVLSFDPHHTVEWVSEFNGKLSHSQCLLHIEAPLSWTQDERYDFDWSILRGNAVPFQLYNF